MATRRIETAAAGVTTAVALGCLTGTPTGLAQDSDAVVIDVTDCVELESPEDRLACFEAQIGTAESR